MQNITAFAAAKQKCKVFWSPDKTRLKYYWKIVRVASYKQEHTHNIPAINLLYWAFLLVDFNCEWDSTIVSFNQ